MVVNDDKIWVVGDLGDRATVQLAICTDFHKAVRGAVAGSTDVAVLWYMTTSHIRYVDLNFGCGHYCFLNKTDVTDVNAFWVLEAVFGHFAFAASCFPFKTTI